MKALYKDRIIISIPNSFTLLSNQLVCDFFRCACLLLAWPDSPFNGHLQLLSCAVYVLWYTRRFTLRRNATKSDSLNMVSPVS